MVKLAGEAAAPTSDSSATDTTATVDSYGIDIVDQLNNESIDSNENTSNDIGEHSEEKSHEFHLSSVISYHSANKLLHFISPVQLMEDSKDIVDDVENGIKDVNKDDAKRPTRQERETSSYRVRRRFFTPKNIMYIEDSPYSRRISVSLLMLSFSYLGNLARISFQQLMTYENAYIYYKPGTMIWINFTSCFIMGLANNAEKFWECLSQNSERKLNLKQIPLHTAITAGFCGCFSTFAGVIQELVFETINGSLKTPNNGYGVMQFFAILITQFGLCLFGLQLGSDFAYFVDLYLVPYIKPYVDIRTCRSIEYLLIFLGFAATITNVVLSIVLSYDYWYKNKYSISLLFGLFGCMIRYKLMELNGKIFAKWFPTGTLLANMLGCIFISVVNLLLHGYKDKETKTFIINNSIQNCILRAFCNGFAGSLSTFAALCNELLNMGRPRYRYTYFFATLLSCFIPAFLILASYTWTMGMAPI